MVGNFMTVVIQMPDSIEQRAQITAALGLEKEFHGGRVTAVSLEDEISRVERYEERYGELDNDGEGEDHDSRPAVLKA